MRHGHIDACGPISVVALAKYRKLGITLIRRHAVHRYSYLIRSPVSFLSEGAVINSKPSRRCCFAIFSSRCCLRGLPHAGLQREEENHCQKDFSPDPETNSQIEEETRSASGSETNEEPRELLAMTPDQQETPEAAWALRIASFC